MVHLELLGERLALRPNALQICHNLAATRLVQPVQERLFFILERILRPVSTSNNTVATAIAIEERSLGMLHSAALAFG